MRYIFTLLAATLNLMVFGQKVGLDSINYNIEKYINRQKSNGKFNGNILIAKGNKILYAHSFGFANRELQVQNSDSTKFLIGSITKPFTALAILILEERSMIDLEDKLSKYFPNFASSDSITISQLLTHTSGISDYKILDDWYEDSKSNSTTPYTTVNKMSGKNLLFKPGEKFRYSNVGYIILGLIIEKISNQSFATFIQENIIQPLHLNNTGIIDNKNIIPHLSSGYTTNPRVTIKAEYINYNQPFASGNMYSTPFDLWKFTKAVMQAKLLSKEKTEQLFNSGQYYGYGWGIRHYEGVKAYGHYGGMNGFVGAITYIPDGDYFVCILTNDDNTPKVQITNDLVSIIQNKVITLPKSTKLIDISNEEKKQVTGNYLIKEGDTLKVFQINKRLYLQENGQARHELFPFDQYQFSFALLEFNAVFKDLKNGKTQVLIFEDRKTILTAKRIK